MNNFARILLVERYSKVTYYTLQINDENISLFGQFRNKHSKENTKKLFHILKWIEELGKKISAHAEYFRPEAETADASALPPKGIDREPTYIEYNEITGENENAANNLRLYCLRVNNHVVFLFNGDIKTTDKAQDCENVRPHFRLANKLTKAIHQAFLEKEIRWNETQTDIIFDKNFELIW